MLEFDEALARVVAAAPRLASERVPLATARGRVLAQTVRARSPIPAFDYSAMDGYAVRSTELDGAGPWRLSVRGESRAGSATPTLERNAACRIFTGAPVPHGADSIVIQEDVEREDAQIIVRARPAPGEHVRRRGEDLDLDQVALEHGVRLGPSQLSLLAALDETWCQVSMRPRVVILCTGDELRAAGEAGGGSSVPESNGVALAALVEIAGGSAALAPLVGDDAQAASAAITGALAACDLLVTVGGASVGDHDVVRAALEAAGAQLEFWKVRIKPGKPLLLSRAGRTPILGVPGNPVSAQLTFALFGVPLLRAMQGDRRVVPARRRVQLLGAVRQKPGRQGFYRGVLSDGGVTPLDNQASGAVTSLAWADALIVVPADSPGYQAGEWVSVLSLSDL